MQTCFVESATFHSKKIDSGIIETDDLFFPKLDRSFSEIHPRHPHNNILKFEKYIYKLSDTTTEAKPPNSFNNNICS